MCGFFQVIQRHAPIDRERFRLALASMQHRGPDQSGELFIDTTVNTADGERQIHLGFGHQRLSILDLSDKSRQPFVIDRDVLLYNGELYNYRELNAGLRQRGITLHTDGDTETLCQSLRLMQEDALSGFNGMWAFSMFREGSRELLFARDRYGKKPLFYYQDDNVFCASSTIRAIQLYLRQAIRFRRDVLLNYLVFSELYPSGTHETHFEDIHQVLPGHSARLNLSNWQFRQSPYFSFYDPALAAGYRAAPGELAELLKDSVRKRLVSDRPVALLLSGGIDSSLILSTLAALGLQEQCKIYMGETGRSADHRYAKECVDLLGIPATTVVLDYDSNTFERFLQVCRHQERPVSLNGSSMGMPQMYEVIAADGIPVVLDGTGGDELFGGYWQRQFPLAVREARRRGETEWLRRQLADGGENDVRRQLLRSFLPAGLLDQQHQLTKKIRAVINPLLRADFGRIMDARPTDPMTRLTMSFSEGLSTDVAPGGRLGEWLWHNDRNSMMSSVEGRSPLLDYRLNRFLYTGYQAKFSGRWNKFELRNVFSELTPLPTQWREQKQGFRWDGKHFLQHNHGRILELIRSNRCLVDLELVDTGKLTAYVSRQPKLLKSTFFKQVLAISGVEQAFSDY